ncbi:MAG TPA: hypothetical protein VFP23_08435 [Solirubrobacterales bacterium]|nr:hypothetical protein [Solirubrobacterales bacterium]
MAETNPTRGRHAVPLDLSPSRIAILRRLLAGWLEDARSDLGHPRGVKNPDLTRQEAEAFERLLSGIADGLVLMPDEIARAAVEAAARAYDEASDFAEIVAHHDALHGLLAALGGEAEDAHRGQRG